MWSFFSRDFSKDFPYVLDNQPEFGTFFSVWSLYKAKKKASNDLLSIFAFDSKNRNETEIEIARQSLKRLKTLRHPTILTYVDSLENEKNMYLVTESVQPLDQYLKTMNFNQNQKELISLWGIYQITKALSFLNNDAKLLHNNINLWSVFVNQTEDWKLAGVEYMNSLADNSVCANKIRSELLVYEPPEKYHMQGAATANDCSSDVWGLGCLIWEIFNGQLNSSTSLKNVTNIPEKLVPIFREITNSKPKNRPNPNEMLQKGTKPGSYFDNSLINIMNFLDEIQIADRNERNRYFDILNNDLDKYPKSLCQNKILPKLIYAYDYGEAGSNILLPLFKISRTLDESQFQKTVLPCLVKLFKSNDRTTRSRLLSHLEYFVEFIPKQLLNDTLFAEIANGFLDSNLTIREQTITAIVCLAPKLNSNNLNNELLRYFANLQLRDENGGIRTNVTICLGKIAEYLEPKSRQKVLISAFIRAMKDPFAAARNSGIVAFAATQQYYLLSDIAQRILPALSQLTIDPDENVRDSAFRTLKGFLAKLEECSKDPTLKENLEAEAMKGKPNLANVAANWTGWAMNAVTAKFHKSTNADISHISANANNSDSANKKQTQNEIKIPASLAVPKTQPALQPTISKLTLNTRTNNFNNDFGDDDYDRKSQNSDLIQWDKEDWGEIETSDVTATTITGTFDNRNSKSTIIAKNRTDIIDDNGNDNDDAWNLDW